MVTQYNFNPYYDDFDPAKNYYRILFKPGYAVQARELTQLQTVIQEQINRFGSAVFNDGSIVKNGNSDFEKLSYYNFQNRNFDIFENDFIIGQTSGSIVQVLKVDGNKIWFKNLNNTEFNYTETVNVYDSSKEIIRGNLLFDTTTPFSFGSRFTIEESIFFVKGHFVFVPQESYYVYNDFPTLRFGLSYEEKIVEAGSDTSLLDPAAGSYNYSAPGADRYQIEIKLDSKTFDPGSYDTNNLASENFIELMRVVDGVIEKRVLRPQLSTIEDTLARRTFDESGNYTVTPFIGRIIPTPATSIDLDGLNRQYVEDDANTVTLSLSPGKAYVKGYEFETTTNTNLPIEKSRSVKYVSGGVSSYSYGNYLYVESPKGSPELSASPKITLRNAALQTIGSAHVTGLVYDSTVGSKNIYKLYLTDLSFLGTNTISYAANVTIETSSPTFFANVAFSKYTSSIPTISTSYEKGAFAELPVKYVESVKSENGTSDTIWYAIKEYPVSLIPVSSNLSSCTVVQFVNDQSFLGSGELSASEVNENFYVVVVSNIGLGPTTGTVLTHATNLRIKVDSPNSLNVSWSNTGTSFTNFGSGGSNQIKLFAKVAISNWPARTKTLTTAYHNFTGNLISNTTVVLPKTDGWSLINVVVSNTSSGISNDVTSLFTFSGGQKDAYYDFASVTRISSFPSIYTTYVPDKLNVQFQYFEHQNFEGFFTVDSYKNSGITYSQIPIYRTSSGVSYNLRDVIDFRKSRVNANTFYSSAVPVVGENINFDYSYYLSRKDRVTVTKNESFKLVRGVPAVNPQFPSFSDDEMLIYEIDIKPYTYSIKDVEIKYVDNRRYTMKDIGRIESRVNRVEYYTALNLIEKQIQDTRFPSSIPGQDKFKSGILVDPFINNSIGDFTNPDFCCSVDSENRELRPLFESNFYNFEVDSSQNLIKRNNEYLLDYVPVEFASQKLSSRFRNVNTLNKTSWDGVLKLSPSSDVWTEVTDVFNPKSNGPDERVDFEFGEQEFYEMLQVGSGKWNNWETFISGLQREANKTQPTTIDPVTNNEIAVTTVSGVIDSRPISVMRPISIEFVSSGHLPDTELYIYTTNGFKFSGGWSSLVSQYRELVLDKYIPTSNLSFVEQKVDGTRTYYGKIIESHENRLFVNGEIGELTGSTPRNVTIYQSTGGTITANVTSVIFSRRGLKSNDFGVVAGRIRIPANSIPTGKFKFVVSDNPDNKGTTWSEADFFASGTKEIAATATITRVVRPAIQEVVSEVVSNSVSETVVVEPVVVPIAYGSQTRGFVSCTLNQQAKPEWVSYGVESAGNPVLEVRYSFWIGFGVYNSTYQYDNVKDEFTITLPGSKSPNTDIKYYFSGSDLVPTGNAGTYLYTVDSTGAANFSVVVPYNQTKSIKVSATRSHLVVTNGGQKVINLEAYATIKDGVTTELVNNFLTKFQSLFPAPSIACPVVPVKIRNVDLFLPSQVTCRSSLVRSTTTKTNPVTNISSNTSVTFVVNNFFNIPNKIYFDPAGNWEQNTTFKIEWVNAAFGGVATPNLIHPYYQAHRGKLEIYSSTQYIRKPPNSDVFTLDLPKETIVLDIIAPESYAASSNTVSSTRFSFQGRIKVSAIQGTNVTSKEYPYMILGEIVESS